MEILGNKLKEILEENFLEASATIPSMNLKTDLSTDTRNLNANQWFFALCGENFDGHNFINKLDSSRAKGLIISKKPASPKLAYILVKDTLKAFQQLAHFYRLSLANQKIIGITGSIGKTTTKEFLKTLLSSDGYASHASFNNEIGVPKTLLSIPEKARFVVVEMGARKTHDIDELAQIVKPDIACCLNIGTAHLEIFGTQENLTNTKLEMYTSNPGAIWFVNIDDYRQAEFLKTTTIRPKKIITYGYSPGADYRILQCTAQNRKTKIVLKVKGLTEVFTLSTPLSDPALNYCAAISMAAEMGIPTHLIQERAHLYTGTKQRFEIIKAKDFTVVDDSYNAHPKSMSSGLKTFNQLFNNSKKVAVLGDMNELGPASKHHHEEMGKLVASLNIDFLITVGQKAKFIASRAVEGGFPEDKTAHFNNIKELLQHNIPLKSFGDCIYAKASNSIQLGQFVNSLR